jgi:two-component system NtrC family sensor kinase
MDKGDLTSARILIVDDEPANVRLLERLLESVRYRQLKGTTDSRRVLDLYRSFQPDLMLLDLLMPHLDGVAVLEQLRSVILSGEYVPVLVLTADATLDAKQRALAAGANDFLTKPFEQFEVVLRIRNLLDTRRLYLELDRQNRSLEETVRERTERLLQSEKVATMGSLLAGVAHELNNPLAVVTGQAQLLHATVSDPAVLRRAEKIDGAARRCVRIVRNFLALARRRAPERGEVQLNDVVQEAVELLAYELRTGTVEVSLSLAEDLPVLWADGHQLHQVLVNIVANAHHALRHSGSPRRLTITTGRDRTGQQVRLTIADTGPGIPAEIRAKIFEPFFTTKPPGEGTGLGLSLCRGIVEEHGGTIGVESEPGRGTTFLITLPVLPRPAVVAAPDIAETPALVGPKTILVVDDEPEIAAILVEALERDGYQAETAENGADALRRLERQSYDLVMSDTKMPVMDGIELYREMERRFPALQRRIIFVTGDVLNAEKQRLLESTGVPVLTKPFDLSEVRRVVRRRLVDMEGKTTTHRAADLRKLSK